MPERALGGGEFGSTTSAAACEDLATCFGGHASAETVPALALNIRRLKCLFHLPLKNPPITGQDTVFKGEMRLLRVLPILRARKKGREISTILLTVKHCEIQNEQKYDF